MRSSIRLKLIVFTFCIVLLVGGGLSLYSIYLGRQRVLTDFKKEALEATELIAGIIADRLYFLDIRGLRDHLESTRANPDISYTYVMDLEGVVLSDGTQTSRLRDQKLSDSFSQAILRSDVWISQADGEILKIGGPVLAPDGSRIGHLQVGFSLAEPVRAARAVTKTSLYITVVCLGIGALLAVLLSASFSRPILAIVRASREIGDGKLDTRLPVERNDELGVLARSINQMADGLKTREAETGRRTRELQALYTVNNTISQSLDIDACMRAALITTIEVLRVDAGQLYIFDEKDNALRLMAHHAIPIDQLGSMQRYAPGEGIVGKVFTDNRPFVFSDIDADPRYRELARSRWAQQSGYRSSAGLPITIRDRPVGVIYLYGRAAREFTPEDIELLSSVGSQIGVAIERARLFQETEQRARQQEALNAIASATTQLLRRDELLEIVLDKVLEVTGRERVSIRLKDAVTGEVTLVAHRGFPQVEVEELLRRKSHRMSEEVFASGRPVVINDGTLAPGREILLPQSRSVAWIPIKARKEVVGVLGVSAGQPVPFSQREVDLLEAIGNVIGVALENARLFEETKRNLDGIRALHDIDMAISSTLDLHEILKVLLDKIDLFLPYSTATVRLLNKESGLLEPVACRNLDEKEWKVAAWKPGRGPANAVFESRTPLMIHNCLDDPRVRDPEFFRKHHLVSYLGVPMFAREEILGVLSFYTKEEHRFTNEEVEFLTTLAGQAAIAIHNSEVYEEMAKLAADLSRSNKVKDEFLSVMSHELRTPLNVVMGYSGMIKDRLLGEINLEQEKALEKVISRARDQLTMISSILQAVQMEAEGVKVESRAVNLREFLDDLSANYIFPLSKELNVVWDYPFDLPVIHTDGEKLKHVLQNLINNAIKFTDKGTVTISVRYLNGEGSGQRDLHRASGNGKDDLVQFQVADSGIGIAKEHQPMIFERFHQVDSSETRRYGGVGIGLYIVKKFTELLGGKVEVESEPGKGSTFTVTIPDEN